MARPTEEELALALNEAARMREQDDDPCYIGKSLLNANYRLAALEDVLHKTKLYLHSGLAATEHTQLLKAIEHADQADAFLGEEGTDLGLR